MDTQKVYGYVRVSTCGQNEARQMIAMKEMGVPDENVYIDRQSGKDFDRPQYKRLLRKLDKESVLYVKSIDRLGRSYTDLIEQWRVITKEKGSDIVVAIASVTVLTVVDALQEHMPLRETLARKSVALRWALIYLCLFAVILFGMYGPGYGSAFIYEQF